MISTNLDEISGNIPSDALPKNNVSYAVTNKREIGGLTLEKVADGEYAAAGVNVTNNTTHEINYTEFTYTVTLTAPENVDFRDYIKWADFTALGATVTKINGTAVSGTPETDFNNAAPLSTIELTVKVKANNGNVISSGANGNVFTIKNTFAKSETVQLLAFSYRLSFPLRLTSYLPSFGSRYSQ